MAPASTTPAASAARRREVGSASARSLLLTVLGEFVLPRDGRAWTASVIEALGALGVEEKAARQALSRTAAEGVLASTRHGRRVAWSLTDQGRALLQEGTARIYGFMRDRHPWDGRWLVLTVSIPEAQRQLRHRLRTQLTWLGLGSPVSGLWVSPAAGRAHHVHRVIRDLDLEQQSFAWVGPATGIGEEARLVEAAWDLEDVEERYLGFLADFEQRRADLPTEAFVAQVEMVQAWRRFPFLDPDLPSELLDHDWPGPRAAAMFHDRHARWHRQAQQEWDRMETDAEARS
ncbi:MAG TPA: PaaX family transcriptional regulator C-terminal domain-containing protein [Marmoricola sp.]|nr:PaaX family transcriptional regulator C-terminal domain-containing protein [Marmoricola sp.]